MENKRNWTKMIMKEKKMGLIVLIGRKEGEKGNHKELYITVRKMMGSRQNLQKEKRKLGNENIGRFKFCQV